VVADRAAAPLGPSLDQGQATPMSRKASNLPYLITSIAALGIIVAAWLGRDRIPSVGPGDAAPNFEVVTLEGQPASLRDYRGQVVLLNIWATWCPPCVYELPSMQRLYEEFRDEPFEIVAVSIDARMGQSDAVGRPGGDIRAFADSLGLTFPILHDPEGRIQRTYMTTGVPESFLIGKDGRIYRKVSGATEWDQPQYLEFVRRLLDEGV
jgi:cytochrome c biogenesis protein CcmG, thiol:disulfide interchange protein DsbE